MVNMNVKMMNIDEIETVMTRAQWNYEYRKAYEKRMKRRIRRGMKLVAGMLIVAFCIGLGSYWETAERVSAETPRESITVKGEVECYQGNTYIFTNDGHIWSVEDENLKDGDKVKVTFDTKGTQERRDDVITSVKHRLF